MNTNVHFNEKNEVIEVSSKNIYLTLISLIT